MAQTYRIENETQTKKLAQNLTMFLSLGDVLATAGDLGAGKTTFSKGLALGLDIHQNIKSPTFTIIKEYLQGRLPFYHMDVYRLGETGADDLGLEEYFEGDGVSVVEWAQLIPDSLPETFLKISLQVTGEDFQGRNIKIEAVGKHYETLLTQFTTIQEQEGSF